jgi:hypothetical protein
MDDQVKVRGYRIELGEIEARLAACESVLESVVIVREDTPGEKCLVAYYVGTGTEGAEELRTQLSINLPEYMLPAAYVRLDKMPLTPNGKVNRQGLPVPDIHAYITREFEDPLDGIEKTIAEIWSSVLRAEKVGRWDNFFELGGHSLQIVTVIERLRRIGLFVDVRTMFMTPTVAGLAAAVTTQQPITVPLVQETPRSEGVLAPEMFPLADLGMQEIERIVTEYSTEGDDDREQSGR